METHHDIIIIGGGISSLVCGCYLAKVGFKVLIIEKQDKVGGCCSSFQKEGVLFDAGVHSLGSCREEGILGGILKELQITEGLKLFKKDITNLVVTRNRKIAINRNITLIIEEFCKNFPSERNNIKNFFSFINSFDINKNYYIYYKRLVDKKLGQFLHNYFKDEEIISILNILLLNINTPLSQLSALSAVMLFKEYIFDGGYYPRGGIQSFPNSITNRFMDYGGEILISHKVSKILLKNSKVIGVQLENGDCIQSNAVVSNCDVRQTFFQLIGRDLLTHIEINKINRLTPTTSLFTIHLGLNRVLNSIYNESSILWYFPKSNISQDFSEVFLGKQPFLSNGIVCSFPPMDGRIHNNKQVKQVLSLFISANYKDKKFWSRNKEKICETIINKAQAIFPSLTKSIIVKTISTPIDIENYTLNYKGATCGWAYIPSQIQAQVIKRNSRIKGLYFAGHWVNQPYPGGVPGVAFVGKTTARLISLQIKHSKKNIII